MKKLLVLAGIALISAACNKNEMPTLPAVDEMTDTPVLISAGVADLTTRAGQPAGELKTGQMGFYMSTEGTNPAVDTKYNKDNLQMSYQEGNGWMADNGSLLLWKNKTSKVSYIAYHPFMELGADNIADVVVPADQNVSVLDLLYTKGETTGQESGEGITLSLKHQMSKLNISLRTGTEFGENTEYLKVVLKGLKNSCEFNMADGTWGTYAAGASDVIMIRNNNEEYEAIVIPQSSSEFMVEITTSEFRVFRYSQAVTLAPGTAYEATLMVGKDLVEIVDGGISVGEWTSSSYDDFMTY